MHTAKYRFRVWAIVATILTTNTLTAQNATISVFVNPRPPSEFYKWNEQPSPLQITVGFGSTSPAEVKINFEIKTSDGRRVAITDANALPFTLITPGVNSIPAVRVFSTDYFTISPEFQNALVKNRSFPEGLYEICGTITDGSGRVISPAPGCGQFSIFKYQSPVLTYPPNDEQLCPSQFQTTVFQWTPMITADPTRRANFHFVLAEIFPGQTAAEALLSNIPVVEQLIPYNQNFLIWPENLIPPTDSSDYAWGVNIVDDRDVEIAGFSEVYRTRCRYGGTTTRDSIRRDSLPPTITTERPPTTTTRDKCSDPGHKTSAGTKVSLGMVLDNPGIAPYPRGVPLRAEGIDWDVLHLLCAGCRGGTSETQVIVRDDVVSYKWRLVSGKGSLNSPFDAKDIDSLASAIQRILERLRVIDDSIASINQLLDKGFDEIKKELESKIEKQKKDKKAAEDVLNRQQKSADSLSKAIGEKQSQLNTVRNELANKRKQLKDLQTEIDTLEKALKSGPNAAELHLAKQIDAKTDAIKNLKEQLASQEKQWLTELQALQDKILQAQLELKNAVDTYNRERDKLETLARQIAALETQLMSSPAGKQFVKSYNDWNKKVAQFIRVYAPNNNSIQTQKNNTSVSAAGVFEFPSATTRSQRFQDFSVQLQQLNSALASACNNQNCSSAGQEVTHSANALQSLMQSLIPETFVINPRGLLRMDTLRRLIAGSEAGLTPFKNTVDNAVNRYEQAQNEYNNKAVSIEQARQARLDAISSAELELSNLEKQLKAATEARQRDDESKKERRTKQLEDARKRFAGVERELYQLGDSIMRMELSVKNMQGELADRQEEVRKSKELIASIDEYMRSLQAEINDIPKKRRGAEEAKKRLNDEKKKLEEELAKLKSKQAEMMAGNKEAVGPFVYYIPPPLEDIIKDKPTFERLKDSVAHAEAALAIAYNKKDAVQGKIVKSIEKTANNLVLYSDAVATIEDLEKEIKELSDDISKEKTRKYQDYLKQQQEVQKEVLEARKKSEEADKEYEEAEKAAEEAADKLQEAKQEMSDHLKKMEEATRKILDAKSQLEYEQKLLDNARSTAAAASRNLDAERENLNKFELELTRAKNDLTRAHAMQKDDAVNNAKSRITQLEQSITQSKNVKIPALEGQVTSAQTSVESAVMRVRNAEKADSTAFKEYSELSEELDELGKKVNKADEKMEAKKNKFYQEAKEQEKAEEEKEAAEKKREETAEDISKQVEEDDDIKKSSGEKEDAESKKEEAENTKTKSENDVKEALKLKDQLIKAADDELKKAKDRLKNAKDELRNFLLKEFETVTLEAKIELTAIDKVVDHWRSSDGKATIVNTLQYPGKRIPLMNNIHPDETQPVLEGLLAVCIPQLSFLPPSESTVGPPGAGAEPRTIALVYKNGEPLWPEWPVIPANQPLLAKDVVQVTSGGSDVDQMIVSCVPNQSICPPGKPLNDNIVDLGNYKWENEGRKIGNYGYIPLMVWEPEKVAKPLKVKPQEIKVIYTANEVAADAEKREKSLPPVKAGVLIECTNDTSGAPKQIYTMQGRVVTGDHIGLAGEEIEFEVKLIKGEAKEFGFDGTALKTKKNTDGAGYAKTDFNFGKGFAEFKIWIRWMRGGKMIEEDTLRATSPLLLRYHRLAKGAPDYSFDAALELFDKGGSVTSAVAKFPEDEEEEEETDDKGITLRAVAGLLDNERDFVKDETIEFKSSVSEADPGKDKTKAFGIARTHISDVPEDEVCEVTASIEQKYEPVGRPAKEAKSTSADKIEKFRIGSKSNPFIVVLDEPAAPGEPISGTGKLEFTVAGQEVLQYLKEITLDIVDVELDSDEDDALAVQGKVTWKAGDDNKRTILGLEFHLTALTILAQKGAGIEGTAKHETFEKPLKFSAELDVDGNFLGSIEDVPKIEVKGFILEEGSAFDIDMHDGKSPGTMEDTFKGILIRTAKLQLPEVFNGADKEPTRLEVENFYIGKRLIANEGAVGFGGKASLTGSFFKMGYAGYEFGVQEFSLEFEESALKAGSFKGELNLPIPFEGKVETEVNIAGEGWSAKVSTSNPVTLPNLGLSMTFKEGCGIEYSSEKKEGKLTINAFLVTKQVGEMDITGFEISSNGSIKAEEITLEKSLKFGSGFDLHAKSIAFAFSKQEYSMTVKGGFSFPRIGINELMGSISVKNGPILEVAFEKAEISFEYNPVTFKGGFDYNGKEFSGSFDIGIKKVLPSGIQGRFVVGNTETPDKTGYSYWYAELKVATKIPLGQTGLSILGMGGGVGYNYTPPIGASEGAPRKTDAFSFKAILEMGTAPGGEVFAGKMEMVLMPGMFSLYGKAWLLTKRESIYGDGQLNLQWDPVGKVDGFIGMFVGIPDNEGEVLMAEGKINFEFQNAGNFLIKSEKLGGSVLQSINAEGIIEVNPQFLNIGGKLYYNTNKSVSIGVVGVKASLNVSAAAGLKYMYRTYTMNSFAKFNGDWDVDLETPLGNADVISGHINLDAQLNVSPTIMEVKASADIAYDVWVYKDNITLDLGYTVTL